MHTSSTQEQLTDGAVVQVLEVKKIEPKAGQSGDRYRLVISDGEHYIQVSGRARRQTRTDGDWLWLRLCRRC